MLASLVVRNDGDLNFGQAVDAQQGWQRDLGLAADGSTGGQRLVVIDGGNGLLGMTRQGHQGHLLAPTGLSSHLPDVLHRPADGQFALGIDRRGVEADIHGQQVGTWNFLDGDGGTLLTAQHVLLLAVGERHAAIDQVDGVRRTVDGIGWQRHVDGQERAAVVEQQVVLVAIDDDTVVGIIVDTAMQ